MVNGPPDPIAQDQHQLPPCCPPLTPGCLLVRTQFYTRTGLKAIPSLLLLPCLTILALAPHGLHLCSLLPHSTTIAHWFACSHRGSLQKLNLIMSPPCFRSSMELPILLQLKPQILASPGIGRPHSGMPYLPLTSQLVLVHQSSFLPRYVDTCLRVWFPSRSAFSDRPSGPAH